MLKLFIHQYKKEALRLRSFYSTKFDILVLILEIKHFIDAIFAAHETSALRICFGTNWVHLFKLQFSRKCILAQKQITNEPP